MLTYNFKYNNKHDLEEFIKYNNIPNSSKVLLQFFSDILDSHKINKIIEEINVFLPNINISENLIVDDVIDSFDSITLSFNIFNSYHERIYTSNMNSNNLLDKEDFLTISKYKMKEYINLVDNNIITSSTNLDGIITYVSKAFCEISGYKKDELMGKPHSIIRHKDTPDHIFKEMWKNLNQNKIWTGEIKNRKKSGDAYWVKATIYPNFDKDGNKIGYTGIRQDITDKKIIEELSITDTLTGLYNRRHFNDIVERKINDAKRNNDNIGFLLIDIDFFKQYNDHYGHQAGDEILEIVAKTMKSTFKRSGDYCFRIGGEEFAIIFNASSKQKAIEYANLFKQNIINLKIDHIGSKLNYLTTSIGLYYDNGSNIENKDFLYKHSDKLLYRAKQNGRNKIEYNK